MSTLLQQHATHDLEGPMLLQVQLTKREKVCHTGGPPAAQAAARWHVISARPVELGPNSTGLAREKAG